MSKVRRILAACATIAVATSAFPACGIEGPTSTGAPPAASAEVDSVPASSGANTQSDVAVGTSANSANDSQTPAPAEPVPPNPVTAPPAPNRDDVDVDARDFQRGDGYFFRSPTGNVLCGINSPNAPGTLVGCQTRYSVPGNTGRECLNTENNTYGVQVLQTGEVQQICTNQGIFVADDMRVLEYGQVIGVTGTFCRSTEAGIACYDGDRGFMISRDVNLAF